MKYIKIGIMGVMMMLMSNVMIIRVEAANYNGYDYYTTGSSTSMNTPKNVDDNVYLQDYAVKETNKNEKNHEYMMSDYLVGGDMYYTIPGLTNTNVLGVDCTTMIPQGICRMDNFILITAYDGQKNPKHNSVIYVLNVSGELKATLVYNKKCHMGGITYDGTYVWIAEGGNPDGPDNGVGVIKKSTILEAVKVSNVKKAKSVKLKEI